MAAVELAGAVHVHTGLSDGTGTPAEIAAAAAGLGLDFVVIADHDCLAVRETGAEGWHGRVLLAAGSELATCHNRTHLLALNHVSTPARFELTVPEALDRVAGEGGAALLAHANGTGLGGHGLSRIGWPWWDHPRLAGCEVWSYMQDWGASFRLLRPSSYRLDLVAPRIAGPPAWVLERWDQQAERRPFAGLGSSDSHAKRLWPFRKRYWPHEQIIGRLLTRVQLDEPLPRDGREAARRLMAALAAGRCCFARDELSSAAGFSFRAEPPAAPVLHPGASAPFAPGVRLVVESPRPAELSVVRLGRPVAAGRGKRLEFVPDAPGAYRAEARLDGRPWAFSNHVRLGKG